MPKAQRRVELSRETRLAALLHHLDRHRRALDVQAELGTADLRLLWLLSDGQTRTLRQIAEALYLEQSTVNRQVNAALRAGHLKRSRATAGAPYVFEPTEDGRAAFDRETATPLELYAEVLGRMGDGDAGEFLTLFGRFVDLYGQAAAELV